jgi:hypothetical protein
MAFAAGYLGFCELAVAALGLIGVAALAAAVRAMYAMIRIGVMSSWG